MAAIDRDKYILEGHTPVPVDDVMEWGKWFEHADRVVQVDILGTFEEITVSTVFLGLDHSFGMGPIPVLFETMIFGGPHDQYQERYATWDEAVAGHQVALKLAKS